MINVTSKVTKTWRNKKEGNQHREAEWEALYTGPALEGLENGLAIRGFIKDTNYATGYITWTKTWPLHNVIEVISYQIYTQGA